MPLPQSEHPFAQYVRILGKGKTGSRSLTEAEAFAAFSMILDGGVLDAQLGAFLMLLRVKEESPEELVGFVRAVKTNISHTLPKPQVDLDWQSYAGKKKHHAWYLLAALTLAKQGIRVCMHGAAGHTLGRVYTANLVSELNLPIAQHATDIDKQLRAHHFCYVPLQLLQPKLQHIIDMRNLFGLRSPVHTLARLINPFDAPTTIQSIFHPAYQTSHAAAARALGYQNTLVIKGDGGEFERNPDARTKVLGLRDGTAYELNLPMLNDSRSATENDLTAQRLWQIWLGKTSDSYGLQAIIETLALTLLALKRTTDFTQAQQLARQFWANRLD